MQGGTTAETPPSLAILRIPRLELEVPVYDGTTDAVLDLAAGRIEDTALPGTPGNVGIAAHRDGFFRVLKDVKEAMHWCWTRQSRPSRTSGRVD